LVQDTEDGHLAIGVIVLNDVPGDDEQAASLSVLRAQRADFRVFTATADCIADACNDAVGDSAACLPRKIKVQFL
jgi:hypothetical protein